MNEYLICKIEELEKTAIARLEKALCATYQDLKQNYTDRITTLELNNAIYDFYEEAMEIVKEICRLYFHEWKN